MWSSQDRMIALPVGTDPVMETMSTRGDDVSAAPTVAPRPLRTAQVPGGGRSGSSLASSQYLARRLQVSGVTSLVFTTTWGAART